MAGCAAPTAAPTTGNVSSKVRKNSDVGRPVPLAFTAPAHVFEIYGEGLRQPLQHGDRCRGRFFARTNGSQRGMHFDQGMYGERTSANTVP